MKRKSQRDNDENDDEREADDFEVGYCKPPKAHRFKPGKSGNPRGRPVGSLSRGSKAANYERMKQIVLQEAARLIQIRDGDKLVEMSAYQAAMRSLSLNAMTGKVASQRLFFEIVGMFQQETWRNELKFFELLALYKMNGIAELRRRRASGVSEEDLIPHPDHIFIDPLGGRVTLHGPISPDEKEIFDQHLALRVDQVEKIQALKKRLRESPGDPEILEMIEICKRAIALIDSKIPERVLLKGRED